MSDKGMQANGGHLDEEALSAYRDGELTPAERVKVDGHLAACERCRLVLRGYELMATALRDQPLTAPIGLRGDLYARLGAPRRGAGWWPALASAAAVAIAVFVATSLFGASTLVEPASAFPLPDATAVALTTSVEIVYPSGVDHDAVAAAVRIEPSVPVQKAWQGDKLVLTPEQPLKPDTTYSVRAPAASAPRVLPPLPVTNVSQSPTPAVVTKFTTRPGVASVSPTPTQNKSGSPTPEPSGRPAPIATAPGKPTAAPVVPTPAGSVGIAAVRETPTLLLKSPLTDLAAAIQRDQARGRLGQQAGEPKAVQVVEQAYENGRMLWRSDERRVYVLLADGKWAVFADTSTVGDEAATPTAKGRFSKILSDRDEVNRQLGKGLGSERVGQGAIQDFASGTLVATDNMLVYALFANHRWLEIGDTAAEGADLPPPQQTKAT
ncbi:MAG: zf-HC2 domain-containing protein, partial [Chloroflexota bacterium]